VCAWINICCFAIAISSIAQPGNKKGTCVIVMIFLNLRCVFGDPEILSLPVSSTNFADEPFRGKNIPLFLGIVVNPILTKLSLFLNRLWKRPAQSLYLHHFGEGIDI
jgi:hypothetical protein